MTTRRRFAIVLRGISKGMDVTRILGPSKPFSAQILDAYANIESYAKQSETEEHFENPLIRDWKCVGHDLSNAFDFYADDQPVADLNDLVARDTIAINPHLLRPRRKANED